MTFMPVNQTFAIQRSVLLRDDATFALGVDLQSGHLYGDLLAKQDSMIPSCPAALIWSPG
jgi:hypothetical protein